MWPTARSVAAGGAAAGLLGTGGAAACEASDAAIAAASSACSERVGSRRCRKKATKASESASDGTSKQKREPSEHGGPTNARTRLIYGPAMAPIDGRALGQRRSDRRIELDLHYKRCMRPEHPPAGE